jgi:hypothetical protein
MCLRRTARRLPFAVLDLYGFGWVFWADLARQRKSAARPHSALGAGGASEDGFAAVFDRCARKSEVIAALPLVHRICAL